MLMPSMTFLVSTVCSQPLKVKLNLGTTKMYLEYNTVTLFSRNHDLLAPDNLELVVFSLFSFALQTESLISSWPKGSEQARTQSYLTTS